MTVEWTSRYVTTVDTIEEAFTFVMTYLDLVGPPPTISIDPIFLAADEGEHPYQFEVVVEGQRDLTVDETASNH